MDRTQDAYLWLVRPQLQTLWFRFSRGPTSINRPDPRKDEIGYFEDQRENPQFHMHETLVVVDEETLINGGRCEVQAKEQDSEDLCSASPLFRTWNARLCFCLAREKENLRMRREVVLLDDGTNILERSRARYQKRQ